MIIAEYSKELFHIVSRVFSKEYEILYCNDGVDTLALLQEVQPEILVLDFDLPNLDGFTLLHMLADTAPPIILGLGRFLDDYALQQAKDLGVGMVLQRPIKSEAIIHHLTQLIKYHSHDKHRELDTQEKASILLRKLDIPSHREGFQQLRVGIPLYAQDPHQSVCKDLYPAIAKMCGNSNGKQVEKCVRDVIRYGWLHRNEQIWQQYFPNHARMDPRCPSNKVFISNLAEKLKSY